MSTHDIHCSDSDSDESWTGHTESSDSENSSGMVECTAIVLKSGKKGGKGKLNVGQGININAESAEGCNFTAVAVKGDGSTEINAQHVLVNLGSGNANGSSSLEILDGETVTGFKTCGAGEVTLTAPGGLVTTVNPRPGEDLTVTKVTEHSSLRVKASQYHQLGSDDSTSRETPDNGSSSKDSQQQLPLNMEEKNTRNSRPSTKRRRGTATINKITGNARIENSGYTEIVMNPNKDQDFIGNDLSDEAVMQNYPTARSKITMGNGKDDPVSEIEDDNLESVLEESPALGDHTETSGTAVHPVFTEAGASQSENILKPSSPLPEPCGGTATINLLKDEAKIENAGVSTIIVNPDEDQEFVVNDARNKSIIRNHPTSRMEIVMGAGESGSASETEDVTMDENLLKEYVVCSVDNQTSGAEDYVVSSTDQAISRRENAGKVMMKPVGFDPVKCLRPPIPGHENTDVIGKTGETY